MTLTERHIECAHLCARLEVAGQEDTKVMALKWGVTRATIYNWFYNWFKDSSFNFDPH